MDINHALKITLDAQHAMLKKLEWCDHSRGYPVCPECDCIKRLGHAPDCEMDRLLNGV